MTSLLALTTMTKSPVSRWGAKIGLCLPRRRIAACEARRPRTTSSASITCHWRVMSEGLGLNVRTGRPSARETQEVAGSSEGAPARGRSKRRDDDDHPRYRPQRQRVKVADQHHRPTAPGGSAAPP